jgi:hypothetical protein
MLTGKGMFIWKIQECHNGDIGVILDKAVKAKYTHVLIKIANGIYNYNIDWERKVDLVPPLVQALKSKGIEAWGWHYLFGDQPEQEAQKAINRIRELGVDGYVLDAEGHYKGKYNSAKIFMNSLTSTIKDIPIALSSYRYPSYHPQLPWNEFLKKVDYNMPQVYWMQSHNPGAQLQKSVAEFRNMSYTPPIIPTGAAFTEWGWMPRASEVLEFIQKAQDMNLSAVNFWEWSNMYKYLPRDIWYTIRDYPWGSAPEAPSDIAELFIEALNSGKVGQIASLYQNNAVHITPERSVQGLDAIKTWYSNLLNEVLPDSSFTLAGFSGKGSIRHLSWTASSKNGNVQNGSDTIGLMDDKIAYHFSEFSITE